MVESQGRMAAKARVKFSGQPFVQPTTLSDGLVIVILISSMMTELFFARLGTKKSGQRVEKIAKEREVVDWKKFAASAGDFADMYAHGMTNE